MRACVVLLATLMLALPVVAAPTPTEVAFTSHAEGAVLSGVVTIEGTAAPASIVSGVRVYVDSATPYDATLGAVTGDAVAWSLVLDTQHVPDREASIMARTVTSGETDSAVINVTISNQPSIAISSPAKSETVSGVVTLTGTATSPYTPLTAVDVRTRTDPYVAAAFTGSATSISWTGALDTSAVPNGAVTLGARVTNALGRTTEVSRSVVVANPTTYDLSIDAVQGSGLANVRVVVRNDGNTHVGSVDVVLDVGADTGWTRYARTTVLVPAFGTTTVDVSYMPRSGLVGTHTMRATVDASARIGETDETDNTGVGRVTFFTPLATFP